MQGDGRSRRVFEVEKPERCFDARQPREGDEELLGRILGAVRTPNASHNAASFRAGVMPPNCEMCERMKSINCSAINNLHSSGLLCSSPIAIGIADCWRRTRK